MPKTNEKYLSPSKFSSRSNRSERVSQTYKVELIYPSEPSEEEDDKRAGVDVKISSSNNDNKFLEGVNMTSSVGESDTSKEDNLRPKIDDNNDNDFDDTNTPLIRRTMIQEEDCILKK